MSNETQQIEINGTKFDIDMRHAKRIDVFKIGTKVKLLLKGSSGDEVKTGVVVGFEPFKSLPTVTVCYINMTWSGTELNFAHINKNSRDKYEMVACLDDDLPIQKQDVLSKLDHEIDKKLEEANDLKIKREYFLTHFNQWFEKDTSANEHP